MKSWSLILAVVCLAALAFVPPDSRAGRDAVEAVAATLDVEQELLDEDLARHRPTVAARNRTLERLGELYRALDAALQRRDEASAAALDGIMSQIEGLEREREEQIAAERLLVERVRDRVRRISLLTDRLASLEQEAQKKAGPVEGRWAVILLPVNQRGNFNLRQSGAVVSGTYELEGGWAGSLQGTFVERKLHLVRIDSKLGRSMEFEGYLSTDGARIRGTWLSYDLSGDTAPSGHWSARRSTSP